STRWRASAAASMFESGSNSTIRRCCFNVALACGAIRRADRAGGRMTSPLQQKLKVTGPVVITTAASASRRLSLGRRKLDEGSRRGGGGDDGAGAAVRRS